ncbi:MAG: gliding motility-associated protein GldL [bacterium P3]|nr:MAG: gliding motility-associated protein GldL [bacterium P3]KWW42429.1 MAG: gliding motility-associated protein GldL [bacterium F083]
MSFIDNIVRSKGYKNFMAKLYGWGAAVVIIGALFKINHWPGAVLMLIIGMGTESVIFFLSAFEPPHVEWDWSLVYPELAGMLPDSHQKEEQLGQSSDPLTQQLDKMLADANISHDLLSRLGQGMENLASNASAIGNMASATAATEKFVNNMDNAADAAGKLLESMKDAPEAVSTLSTIYKETAQSLSGGEISYADEMKKMAASLSSINAMYEMQMQNSTSQIEATKEIQDRMQSMMKNFADSAEGVLKYKEQVDALSRKVSELNNVYGNMLAAMQTRI